jgi:hypothetical protein
MDDGPQYLTCPFGSGELKIAFTVTNNLKKIEDKNVCLYNWDFVAKQK